MHLDLMQFPVNVIRLCATVFEALDVPLECIKSCSITLQMYYIFAMPFKCVNVWKYPIERIIFLGIPYWEC